MRLLTRFILYMAALAAPVSVALGGAGNVRAPDRIIYTTLQPANWDIYLFSKPREAPRRLTDYPGLDYDPVVSPDGRWLVFCSERRGNPDLYALDLQRGGEPRLLIEGDFLKDQATFSPDGKLLYFVSTLSGHANIYRLSFRPDRTQSMKRAERLTRDPEGDFRPAVSPDGRVLAFSSSRDLPVAAVSPAERIRSGDIWTLDLVNKRLRRLTQMSGVGWNGSPKWSADGKQIAYYHVQGFTPPPFVGREPRSRIWVMDADGSRPRAVTPEEMSARSPEFLPDGRIIYSRRNSQGRAEIVSVDRDGSGARVESDASMNSYWDPSHGPGGGTFVAYGTGPVAPDPPEGYHRSGLEAAAYGPAGPVLVPGAPFRRMLPDRQVDLYPVRYFFAFLDPRANRILHFGYPSRGSPVTLWLSSLDGSQQHPLLELEPTEDRPVTGVSWSRNGQWIAFTRVSRRTGANATTEADVWKMRSDGTDLRDLTPNTPGFDGYPSFSGDDKQIVFRSTRHGGPDLYLMNADGGNVRQLTHDGTHDGVDDLFPTFSPTSNQIAFVSNRDNPKSDIFDIYLLDLHADGTPGKLRGITRNEGQHGHLRYSYDGKWLIYASERGGISDEEPLAPALQQYGELYAYRIQDGALVRLTHNKWEEGIASWEAPLPPG